MNLPSALAPLLSCHRCKMKFNAKGSPNNLRFQDSNVIDVSTSFILKSGSNNDSDSYYGNLNLEKNYAFLHLHLGLPYTIGLRRKWSLQPTFFTLFSSCFLCQSMHFFLHHNVCFSCYFASSFLVSSPLCRIKCLPPG